MITSVMVAKVEDSSTPPDAAGAAIAAAALKCPRCDSTNTKFCYYNNYSLAQPRHFCKACKRYWTRGGTLRNVPVGGGCRKNKRHKKPQPSSASDAAPRKQPPSRNSLPPPPPTITADITPLLYGLPPLHPLPGTSSPNLFFPGFDLDSHLAVYEDSFPSSLAGAHLADLQPSTTPMAFLGDYSVLNPQIPSSSPPTAAVDTYQPLMLSYYNDLPMGNQIKENTKINHLEAINSFIGAASAADPSFPYWN